MCGQGCASSKPPAVDSAMTVLLWVKPWKGGWGRGYFGAEADSVVSDNERKTERD
ncbi:hypothetical protein LDENG_00088640 [Lucifuga dentata]|nr:hypothetical protein LDENG_00088640 [Lucifuga dentata]